MILTLEASYQAYFYALSSFCIVSSLIISGQYVSIHPYTKPSPYCIMYKSNGRYHIVYCLQLFFRNSVHHSSKMLQSSGPSRKSSVSVVSSWQFFGRVVASFGGSASATICSWDRPRIRANIRHISYFVKGSEDE